MTDHDRGEGRTSDDSATLPADAPCGQGHAPKRGGFLAWLDRFDAGRFIALELLVVVGTLACFSAAQSDTYWHLAAGRAMSQSGRVMLTDEFSHTNFGASWLNYEWLSQVIFYNVHRVGGMPLLTALCALLAVGSCILAWKLVRGPVADRALLVVVALPLVTPGWSLRPQAFTMFLLVAVVHLVVRERFLLLPPLFCLWANLHGAVALGLVVLVADIAAALVSRRGWRRRAAFGMLSFGATLLTPLGPALWPEVWRSVSRSSVNQITEWMPPALALGEALFWVLSAVFTWLLVTRWRRLDRQADRSVVLTAMLLLLLAVRASRNVVPFGLLVAPAISVLLWRPDEPGRLAVAPGHRAGSAVRALLFAVSLAVAVLLVHQRWTMTPPPADWAPVSREAASAIRGCPGPIYNHFNTGGFLIWFVPEQRVFLDSRHNPYPDHLLRAQREARDPAALRELLAQYHVRCAVLEPGSLEVRSLGALGWTESYKDRRWVVITAPAAGAR
jgi:hypothetical protein